jgi:NDP-mannose synthase
MATWLPEVDAGHVKANGKDPSRLRAVILAGGKGTRLYPYTAFIPKPLVPLGDVPILEVMLRQLIRQGITDFTLTLGHLAELTKAYFLQHKSLMQQSTIRFVEEEHPTGTAGSLANVPGLSDTFLVMNGDLLTDLDFQALIAFHKEQKAQITIATYRREVKIDLGVLQIDPDSCVNGYLEKPSYDFQVSMGAYVYEPSVLEFIQPGQYLDFPTLVLRILEAGEKVCAFPWSGYWLDIGRPDDYAKAQELFAERPQDFGFPASVPTDECAIQTVI